jgi:hypothetical protein
MDFIEELIVDARRQAAAKATSRSKAAPATDPAPETLFQPYRLVALFHRIQCHHCGTAADAFEGLFEERKHVRLPDLHMVRQPFIPGDSSLPRVRKYLPIDVPYCAACSGLDTYKAE